MYLYTPVCSHCQYTYVFEYYLHCVPLLLHTYSVDEQTTKKVLSAHTTYINLCGCLHMTSPRDAFLTALCKASLPPKYVMSLITQPSKHPEVKKTSSKTEQASSGTGSPECRSPPSHISGSMAGGQSSSPPQSTDFGARRKLDLSESSNVGHDGAGSEGGGGGGTPTISVRGLGGGAKEQQQSGVVRTCTVHMLLYCVCVQILCTFK